MFKFVLWVTQMIEQMFSRFKTSFMQSSPRSIKAYSVSNICTKPECGECMISISRNIRRRFYSHCHNIIRLNYLLD